MRKKIIGFPLSTMLSALSFFGAMLFASQRSNRSAASRGLWFGGMLGLAVCKQPSLWLRACSGAAYQRTVLCRRRPISQKVMLFVETFMTFPFRLALVLNEGDAAT